jgi:hypothetical protein
MNCAATDAPTHSADPVSSKRTKGTVRLRIQDPVFDSSAPIQKIR